MEPERLIDNKNRQKVMIYVICVEKNGLKFWKIIHISYHTYKDSLKYITVQKGFATSDLEPEILKFIISVLEVLYIFKQHYTY